MTVRLKGSPIGYTVAAIVIAVLALVGRILDVPVFYQVIDGLPETSINTVVLIIMMSLALLFRAKQPFHISRFWATFFFAGLVFAFSLSNLIEVLSGQFFGLGYSAEFGELQLASFVSSPQTSILFFLLSSGLLSGLLLNERPAYYFEQGFVTAAAFFVLVYASAYLNRVPAFYESTHHLGIGLTTLLAVGCLTYAMLLLHSDKGFLSVILKRRLGSFLLRRSLVFVVGALISLSLIHGFLTMNQVVYADGLIIAAMLLLALGFLYTYSLKINAIEEHKDRIEGYFEEVFRAAPNGLVLVNGDRQIIMANDYMAKISEYSREELKGMLIEELVPEHLRQDHAALSRAYIQHPRPRPMGIGRDLALLQKSGGICPVEISISPAKVNHEQITVAAVIDISPRLEMEHSLHSLERKAYIDSLTQINNREWFDETIHYFLEGAKRSEKKVAFCFCDLDGFKQINDKHGHSIGDEVLVEVSKRMQHVTRKEDAVVRFGGDEFIILINHVQHKESVERVLQALIDVMNTPIVIGNLVVNCSASIGVSFFPDDGDDPEELIKKADNCLYQVKKKGKNDFSFVIEAPESD